MHFEELAIAPDGFFEAEIERVADKGVAYADFVEVGNARSEEAEVVETEVMACVEAEAAAACLAGGGYVGLDGGFGVGGIFVGHRAWCRAPRGRLRP